MAQIIEEDQVQRSSDPRDVGALTEVPDAGLKLLAQLVACFVFHAGEYSRTLLCRLRDCDCLASVLLPA